MFDIGRLLPSDAVILATRLMSIEKKLELRLGRTRGGKAPRRAGAAET